MNLRLEGETVVGSALHRSNRQTELVLCGAAGAAGAPWRRLRQVTAPWLHGEGRSGALGSLRPLREAAAAGTPRPARKHPAPWAAAVGRAAATAAAVARAAAPAGGRRGGG